MPAFYAHHRFGGKVARKMDGELKQIIREHYTQYAIGLQGPDILFYYRPYTINKVIRMGTGMHAASAYPFFTKALDIVKKYGRHSPEYAYLLGFICHFILDSVCHPFVAVWIEKSGVKHLEIEEEFEKKLLRLDQEHPLAFATARLIPVDDITAMAICPFYDGLTPQIIKRALLDMRIVKGLFTAPGPIKYGLINAAMHLSGQHSTWKGLMNQPTDNPKCVKSNEELLRLFYHSVKPAVSMIESFDESLQNGTELNKRFDRNFE